jgi:type VI secretion system protein VasG
MVAELVRACLLPDSGARNIDSLLDQQLLPVLSRELLERIAAQHTQATTRQGKPPFQIRLAYSDEDGIGVEFDESPAEVTA